MGRNLKTLGLCLAAVLAMCGVGTAVAQASEFTAASYPAAVTGHDIGGEKNALTAFGQSVTCSSNSYSGELTGASTTFVITPVYKTCKSSGLSSTVTTNGCQITLHTIAEEGSEDTWPVTTSVTCPVGKKLEVHVYFNEAHTVSACTIKVGAQSGLKGITVTNETPGGTETVEGEITGIHANKEGLCGAAETSEGVYHLHATFEGKTEGEETDIDVGPDLPVIIGTSTPKGGGSKPVSTTLTGAQIGAGLKLHKINPVDGKLEPNPTECATVTFDDLISAAGSTQAFLVPTFSGACKADGFFATVKPEGCGFKLHEFQKIKVDEYSSKFSLECPATKDMTVQMYAAADEKTEECKLTLQTTKNTKNLSGVTLHDKTNQNPLDDVTATINVKLEYVQTGKCGDKTAYATLTGEVTITGDNSMTLTEGVDVAIID